MGDPLGRAVLGGPVEQVAPALLGTCLVHDADGGVVVVRLTEVEAYAGEADPASHAWRGRTARTAVMYGPAGHAYVYFSYGMHWCMNIVTGPDGQASAVLVRAGEVVEGIEAARQRRGPVRDRDLARGPARLCAALGIGREQNGADLFAADSPVRLTGSAAPRGRVLSGPRVGVSRAAQLPWRFWLAGEPTVSSYRPHTSRPRRTGA